MSETDPNEDAAKVRIWDLPTRLFHWSLVLLVTVSIFSAETGFMEIHVYSGEAIIALILFRIGWGIVGGRHARFVDFVRGPMTVIAYARDFARGTAGRWAGHNPLGGMSVVAMLLVIGVQAGLGLFSNDDILVEGPLFELVEKQTSDYITGLHETNGNIIIALILIHLAAITTYYLKGENLIKPMLRGWKRDGFTDAGNAKTKAEGNIFIALGLIILAAGITMLIVTP